MSSVRLRAEEIRNLNNAAVSVIFPQTRPRPDPKDGIYKKKEIFRFTNLWNTFGGKGGSENVGRGGQHAASLGGVVESRLMFS
eukprot:1318904-Amorphochlora_amoeboformis.AAC.2